jgi:amino acid adenylation domain-containing protein
MGQERSIPQGKPLSAAQQRFWVLEQLHPEGGVQNISSGLRFARPIDPAKLAAAIRNVAAQHEILRARFRSTDGTPLQFSETSAVTELRTIDLRDKPDRERQAEFERAVRNEITAQFDLGRDLPIRSTLFQLGQEGSVLLLVVHRIVCDRLSLKEILREVHARYNTRLDVARENSTEPRQYQEILGAHVEDPAGLSYWSQQLTGAPATLDLLTDRQRPALQTFSGASQNLLIEASAADKIRKLAHDSGASLFETLLAAYAVLLHRYSKQEDLVIGTRVSGRSGPEFVKIVGPLDNMLALRVGVSGGMSFYQLVTRVHEVIEGAVSHEDVPFESVVRELHLDRDMSRHPLFQVAISMQEVDARDFDLGPEAQIFEPEHFREELDLSIDVHDGGRELKIRFSYNTDLFDASTIERMTGHFRNLLESVAENPQLTVSRIPLMSTAERRQLLVEWNDTRVSYPRDIPLHHLIEEQVKKTPESVALVYESVQLTYRGLNHRANQLARFLRENGVGPNILVGVCAERSVELVIALLAAMKAGGAYVPIDPEYPKDRLETMLQDANPPVVLTQAHLLDRLPTGPAKVFCLDRDWSSIESLSGENLPTTAEGKNLAYAIYTSGSTGKPKGVPNVHEGIVNRLLWMQDAYQLTGEDRVLQKTPFSFDVSVWEFFWPLLAGARLVVAQPGGHRDPSYLVNLIAEQGITTLHFVPSMLGIFLEADGLDRCRSIRKVFASGEALPFELQQRFFERMKSELHNLYGPTEAAVDVTYWQCRPDDERTFVPIGRPVANTQIYILDALLEPVPIGVAGELHIGGIQLARGYLNRPQLTAEKFIPDPFADTPGRRLYKTGDLARFLPDGNIEYLGRIDFQVKLRGFRIELGEIEAVLGECQGVLQAVVAVCEDHPGDKRLVAYLLASPSVTLDWEAIKAEIKDRLPEYMVPSRFLQVQQFPMTTSGKIDRKALPVPPLERSETVIVAPRTEMEAKLATLFSDVLGVPSVGVTDNFFDLGGHSLLAARLLNHVKEVTGQQIPLSAMFRGATVESLARLIERPVEINAEPVLVEIQRGTDGHLPFFAIVPPGEESLGYAMLARHMGPEQAVYKVQGHSPVTQGKRPYTEEEMEALSDEYITAMRSLQFSGPYCLGGFCDGTHIGEQIVLKLESQGEEVGLFAIFDTWVMQHSQNRLLWKLHYYGLRLREMKDMSLSERITASRRVAGNKVQNLVGSKPARVDWRQTYWPERFTPPRFRAPVVLFKRPKQPFYYVNDPQMGWGRRSTGGVEIHEVAFSHREILREPQVGIFGRELAEYVARIRRGTMGRDNSFVTAGPEQLTS